jgi:hypothetical protein
MLKIIKQMKKGIFHNHKPRGELKMNRKLLFGIIAMLVVASVSLAMALSPNPDPGHTWDEVACDNNMCVDNVNGKVGIGTTSPGNVLTIKPTSNDYGITIRETDDGGNAVLIGANADRGYIDFLQGGSVKIELNAYPGAANYINNGGNVGIGTTSPGAKLDVAGGINAQSLAVSGSASIGTNLYTPWIQTLSTTDHLRIYGPNIVGYGVMVHVYDSLMVQNLDRTQWRPVKASAFTVQSDARVKKNVQPLSDTLTDVLALKPVTFEYKDGSVGTNVGLIAQDVEPLFPEVVSTDKDGYKFIDYGKLTPILIKAIQEQQQEINDLKARVAALE